MREYVKLGAAPTEEDCIQVGIPGYAQLAHAESTRYIARLRAVLGPEPSGAHLAIKTFSHGFGTYKEVVCWYEPDMPAAADYARRCGDEAPGRWTE